MGSLALFALAVAGTALLARSASRVTEAESAKAESAKAESAEGPAGSLAPVSAVVAGTDTAPQSAPSADRAVGTLVVRDATGKRVPLVTKGQPAIVMVSSVTCPWCKKALHDLGEMSNGRPLPRLKLLTLEGAADGAPMLAKEHITGAQLIGPAGSSDQVLLTFRFNGTPTFVAIDRNGRVVATLPGYPIRDVLQHWYAVMVGDADVP